MNDWENEGTYKEFIVVNKANGLVLTDESATTSGYPQMMAAHFDAVVTSPPDAGVPTFAASTNQEWQFRIGGCGGSTNPWTPSSVIYGNSVASSLWWDISDGQSAVGTEVGTYRWDGCDDNQTFYLRPSDSGNVMAIQGYGAPTTSSLFVSANYDDVVTNIPATPGQQAAEPVEIENYSGYDNQLWMLIPSENIDYSP